MDFLSRETYESGLGQKGGRDDSPVYHLWIFLGEGGGHDTRGTDCQEATT